MCLLVKDTGSSRAACWGVVLKWVQWGKCLYTPIAVWWCMYCTSAGRVLITLRRWPHTGVASSSSSFRRPVPLSWITLIIRHRHSSLIVALSGQLNTGLLSDSQHRSSCLGVTLLHSLGMEGVVWVAKIHKALNNLRIVWKNTLMWLFVFYLVHAF